MYCSTCTLHLADFVLHTSLFVLLVGPLCHWQMLMSHKLIAVAVLSMSIAGPTGSLNVTGNVGEEPVEEVGSLACSCSDY